MQIGIKGLIPFARAASSTDLTVFLAQLQESAMDCFENPSEYSLRIFL